MHSHVDSILEFQIHDLEISEDEAVCKMVNAHEEGDNDGFKKAYQEYQEYRSKIKMGYEMAHGGLEEWDWKWVADTGNMCEKDWEWFGDEFEKAGVNREEWNKKWKA